MQFHFLEHYYDLDPEVKIIKKRVHVVISGRVQGVWFRASTKQKAEQFNIFGWVKNTFDGKVEAVFEGEEKNIDKMIQWCHEGPNLSKVTDVNITSEKYLGEYKDFKVAY